MTLQIHFNLRKPCSIWYLIHTNELFPFKIKDYFRSLNCREFIFSDALIDHGTTKN